MQRIRLVFLSLALVLLVSLGLVVEKALDSVASERSMRHRVVADRIVDEMERELTTWLRREEDRPFAQYRYFYVPDGSASQLVNLSRSPLSRPPEETFLVCYFQIDPDGTISSPLWPDNEELATLATGWQPVPAVRAVVDLVADAVGDFWASVGGATSQAAGLTPGEAAGLTPGETVADFDRSAKEEAFAAKTKEVPRKKKPPDESQSLTYLSKLNRGASSREARPTKVEPSQAANVYNFLQTEANVLQEAVQVQAENAEDDQATRAEPLATTPEIEQNVAETLATDYGSTIDVRMGPMVGQLATANHLVLYRTVSIGDQAYVQGLMLDVAALVRWAGGRVLSDGDLASRARIALAGDAAEPGPGTYRYPLAEPFAKIVTEVTLDPLPEKLGPVNLYSLSLLLAFASTFGLFALYRMVAVVVAYAERRNNFVSAVTHELKTPLTAIRMYGEMLRDGVVPEESKRQQYYEIMTAETERLTRLIQNVLELSQLEQQRRPMKIVAGEVVPVVEEVLDVLRPHAEGQGFTFLLRTEEDLPLVRYDRDALVQVLFNVVDNALKYSRKAARKEIVLSCRRQGDGVVLAVSDRGPGVARQHLKKIFEPFYRAEDELTRTAKGTGIGLALVRGLVERMGGTVAGRNSQAGGFEIEVLLPAAA